MAITIEELVTEIGFKVNQAPLRRVEASLQKLTRLGRNLTLLAGGNLFGIGAAFRVIGQFEQTEIALDVLIGDAELAKKTFEELAEFAARTPFNFSEVARLSTRLLAFDFEANKLVKTMTILGNIASAVGTERLPALVLALGQVKTATRLRGQELRQFNEAGVGLQKALGIIIGKTTKEVAELVSKGAISFELVEKALEGLATGSGKFAGLMERQSLTLFGIFNNIVDRVQLTARAVGQSGLLGEAKAFLNGILDLLTKNKEEVIDVISASINAMILLMKRLGQIFVAVTRIFRSFSRVVGGADRALTILVNTFAIMVGLRIAFLMGNIAIGLSDVAFGLVRAAAAGRIFNLTLGLIPLLIGAALLSLPLLIEDLLAFAEGRDSLFGAFLESFEEVFPRLSKAFQSLFDTFVEPFADFLADVIVEGFSSGIDRGIEKLKATGIGSKIFGAISNVSKAGKIATSGELPEIGRQALVELGNPIFDLIRDFRNKGLFASGGPIPIPSISGSNSALAAGVPGANNRISLSVNVVGLSAQEAEKITGQTMAMEFDKMVRETSRETRSTVER